MGDRKRWSLSALRSLGRSGAVVGAAVRALRAESQGGVRWSLSAPWSLGVLAGRVRLSGLLCGLYGRRVRAGYGGACRRCGVLEGRVRLSGLLCGLYGRRVRAGYSGDCRRRGVLESWRVGCGCRGCCAGFTGGESGRGTVESIGAVESWSLGGAGAVVGAAVRALRAESRCWRRRGRGEFFGAERFGPPVAPEGAWLLASKGGSKRGRTVVFTLLPSTCRRRSG